MAGFWDEEELVGQIDKNGVDQILIKRVRKGNRKYIDIRQHILRGEELQHTQKGISIPEEMIPQFLEVMYKL